MSSYLYITLGPLEGSKIRLRKGLTLGREKANVNLKDPKVSNVHARVSLNAQGQWEVTDMKSRNGVYYKGQKRKKLTLHEGMSILIGDSLLTLRTKGGPPSSKKGTLKPETVKSETVESETLKLEPWKRDILDMCHQIRPK